MFPQTSLSLFTFIHWRRKWQPLHCSCLENPRDGGAWWAALYGVAQSRRRLKRLSSSSSSTYLAVVRDSQQNSSQIASLLDSSFPVLALEALSYGRQCPPLPAPFLCWKPTLTGPLLLNKCSCSTPTSWKACDLTANKLSVCFLGQGGCK